MKSDWLNTSSLDFSIGALSAINVLSIDYKLKVKNVQNPMSTDKIEKSRQQLLDVLNEIKATIHQHASQPSMPALGTEPYIEQLARRFTTYGQDKQITVQLPIEEIIGLLNSESPDISKLIQYLGQLRQVIKQQSDSDSEWIWGNV